jgi:hypothetical protein
VTNKYFDDAAFIGDSITTGIKLYDIMSNASVYAAVGTRLENIATSAVVPLGSETVTILEAIRRTQPGKNT